MKKLIIISSQNFDNNNWKKLGVNQYISSKQINVELWRLRFIEKNLKDLNNKYLRTSDYEQDQKKNIQFIDGYKDLASCLNRLKEDAFIYDFELFNRNCIILFLYRYCRSKIISHHKVEIPFINFSLKDYYQKIIEIEFYKLPKILLDRLKIYTQKKIGQLIGPKIDILFVNGKENTDVNIKANKKIKLHTHDYDRFLEEENSSRNRMIKDDYALFLDMGYPVPNDNIYSKEKPVTTEEIYKTQMVKLLKKIELNLPNKKLIVAMHPKTDKKNFYGFESYQGITPNLIKHSSFVLSHDSSSLQLSALWKKPTILLTSNDMKKRITKIKSFKFFSRELGLPVINIDNYNDASLLQIIKQIEFFDEKKNETYKNFIVNYIKSNYLENKNTSIPETIIDAISNY